MKLTSSRLAYLPLTEFDLADLFELDCDPEVMKFYKRLPPKNKDEAKVSLDRYLTYANVQSPLGVYKVTIIDSGEFIGLGILAHIELNTEIEKVEVGYRLKKNFWGNGFATEIARTLIDFGFHHLRLTEIYGTTNPEHIVSQIVLKKVGLTEIGPRPWHGGCTAFCLSKNN